MGGMEDPHALLIATTGGKPNCPFGSQASRGDQEQYTGLEMEAATAAKRATKLRVPVIRKRKSQLKQPGLWW